MPRRNPSGGVEMTPQDEKLLQLQQLQGVTQPQDDTGDMVKMLGELYSIHQKQQETPAQVDMLKSHSRYYDQLGAERPEERNARAMQLELQGLDKAYTYDPTNPEYHQARKSVLSKYGYNVEAPAAAKPAEAFGAGTSKSAPASTTNTPGHIDLGNPLHDLPIQTANLGRLAYNHLVVPPSNLLGSVLGTPPLHTEPPITDYSGLAASIPDWLKPKKVTTAEAQAPVYTSNLTK